MGVRLIVDTDTAGDDVTSLLIALLHPNAELEAITICNGNVEFDSSQPFNIVSSQITEVTPADPPQTVWQMDITGEWAYRGRRIPSLYPGVTWQK